MLGRVPPRAKHFQGTAGAGSGLIDLQGDNPGMRVWLVLHHQGYAMMCTSHYPISHPVPAHYTEPL